MSNEALLLTVGFTGQGLFTLRVVYQWFASERAGRVVIPRGYWGISLAASLLLLIYATTRGDPVFLVGPLVSATVFSRNLLLPREGQEAARRTPLRILIPVTVFLAAALLIALSRTLKIDPKMAVAWFVIGAIGQALWLSRNLVQWWFSERAGRSVLPPAYFIVSIAGALLLFAYAIRRVDPVFIVAYALNPIPFARNLMLYVKAARREAGAGEAGVDLSGEPRLADPVGADHQEEA